jgi:hypothetical protein
MPWWAHIAVATCVVHHNRISFLCSNSRSCWPLPFSFSQNFSRISASSEATSPGCALTHLLFLSLVTEDQVWAKVDT